MILIAHKGNTNGPNPERENTWSYIEEALEAGYHVETDVSFLNGKFYIGHDDKKEEVSGAKLMDHRLWLHCKNVEALYQLGSAARLVGGWSRMPHYFWHQEDDYTLTSDGWIWTYPGKDIEWNSIAVMPEKVLGWDISKAYGVCTDYPCKFAEDEECVS